MKSEIIYGGVAMISAFLGVIIGEVTVMNSDNLKHNFPAVSEVQQGFVVPSKLEIKLKDLDGNGQKEVIMDYDGKNYFLILDSQGTPRVQAYEIKPAEIAPK